MYKIDMPFFEGPLDLLLFLIRSQEIDIYDIPVSKITKQFIEYIELLRNFDIEISSEFINMVSELVYIKTRMLLPKKKQDTDLSESEKAELEDPRDELVEKLIEYKQLQEAIDHLDESEVERRSRVFIKEPESLFDLKKDEDELWKPLSVLDLVKNFEDIIKKIPTDDSFVLKKHKFTVQDKIDLVRQKLKKSKSILLNELMQDKSRPKLEFICIFLALLELTKIKEIVIYQHALFEDIKLEKNPENIKDIEKLDKKGSDGE